MNLRAVASSTPRRRRYSKRRLALGMIEQDALVIGRGAFVDAKESLTLAQVALIVARVRSFDDDAVALRHLLHGLGKSSGGRTA